MENPSRKQEDSQDKYGQSIILVDNVVEIGMDLCKVKPVFLQNKKKAKK